MLSRTAQVALTLLTAAVSVMACDSRADRLEVAAQAVDVGSTSTTRSQEYSGNDSLVVLSDAQDMLVARQVYGDSVLDVARFRAGSPSQQYLAVLLFEQVTNPGGQHTSVRLLSDSLGSWRPLDVQLSSNSLAFANSPRAEALRDSLDTKYVESRAGVERVDSLTLAFAVVMSGGNRIWGSSISAYDVSRRVIHEAQVLEVGVQDTTLSTSLQNAPALRRWALEKLHR